MISIKCNNCDFKDVIDIKELKNFGIDFITDKFIELNFLIKCPKCKKETVVVMEFSLKDISIMDKKEFKNMMYYRHNNDNLPPS